MALLMIIVSLVGFILSLSLHLLGLFNLYNPPKLISLLLRLGILLIFLSWCFISKKTRGDASAKEFHESLWDFTPKWMAITTGMIVIYALIGFLNAFAGKYSGSSAVNTSATEAIRGVFPSYWVALYAIVFQLFYSYKCLTDGKASDEK